MLDIGTADMRQSSTKTLLKIGIVCYSILPDMSADQGQASLVGDPVAVSDDGVRGPFFDPQVQMQQIQLPILNNTANCPNTSHKSSCTIIFLMFVDRSSLHNPQL